MLAFITTDSVMNSPTHENIRQYLVKSCDLISAVRFPYSLFNEIANTSAGTDLIILQKNNNKKSLSPNERKFTQSKKIDPEGVLVNDYYGDLRNIIHTKAHIDTDQYGKPAWIFEHSGSIEKIVEDLFVILNRDLKNINLTLYRDNISHFRQNQKQGQSFLQGDLFNPAPDIMPFDGKKQKFYKENTLLCHNNKFGYLVDSEKEESSIKIKYFSSYQAEKVKLYIDLRDCYYILSLYEEETQKQHIHLRETLNEKYDEFLNKYGTLNSKENLAFILTDANGREVLSIERYVNGKSKKADIFFAPVSISNIQPETLEPLESLIASLNKFGNVN